MSSYVLPMQFHKSQNINGRTMELFNPIKLQRSLCHLVSITLYPVWSQITCTITEVLRAMEHLLLSVVYQTVS